MVWAVEVTDTTAYTGSVMFSVGCHSGLNVPDQGPSSRHFTMGEKGPHGVEERFEEQDESGIDGGDISAGHRVQGIGDSQLNDSQ